MSLLALALLTLAVGIGKGSANAPLVPVKDLPVPGEATRFDYQWIDAASRQLYIAHLGAAALLVFDLEGQKVAGEVKGSVSTESGAHTMALDVAAGRAYALLPKAHRAAAFTIASSAFEDRASDASPRRHVQAILLPEVGGRIDHLASGLKANRLLVAALGNVAPKERLDGLRDADNVWYDEPAKLARVPTAAGARTLLWVPALSCLFVAAPAGDGKNAAILVLEATQR